MNKKMLILDGEKEYYLVPENIAMDIVKEDAIGILFKNGKTRKKDELNPLEDPVFYSKLDVSSRDRIPKSKKIATMNEENMLRFLDEIGVPDPIIALIQNRAAYSYNVSLEYSEENNYNSTASYKVTVGERLRWDRDGNWRTTEVFLDRTTSSGHKVFVTGKIIEENQEKRGKYSVWIGQDPSDYFYPEIIIPIAKALAE